MIYFRSLLFYTLFLPLAFSFGATSTLYYLVTKKRIPWILRPYGWCINTLLYLSNNIKIKYCASTKIEKDKPYLLIANHISSLDTIILNPLIQDFNFTYVIKETLLQWKSFPFNLGCIGTGCIPVSRKANSGDFEKMVKGCENAFENKTSVLLFPAGTRSQYLKDSIELPSTGALLARKLKCQIIPVFFNTTNWGNGNLVKDAGLIRPGRIEIYLGDPITVEKVKIAHQEVLNFMETSFHKDENLANLMIEKDREKKGLRINSPTES